MTTANRSEIILRIKKAISDEASGTLSVHGKDGSIAMFGFAHGQIISLLCGGLRGLKSLPRFIDMLTEGGDYQFDQLFTGRAQEDLPSTTELLTLLESGNAGATGEVSKDVIAGIANALGDCIGPIAPVLCKNYIKKVGKIPNRAAAHAMILKLATEIEDPAKRQQFVSVSNKYLTKLD